MTALYIIGGIVLLFVLIGHIPAGAEAALDEYGFSLYVRAGPVRISLGGKGEKPEKKGKSAAEQGDKPAETEKKKPRLPPWPLMKSLAKRGLGLLFRLVRRFRFTLLRLHFTAAFPDPCDTAMAYAAAGTAMDMLKSTGSGRIEKADLRAEADFDSEETRIDFRACLTIRIGAFVGQVLRFGVGLLKDYLQYRIAERKTEHGKQLDQ